MDEVRNASEVNVFINAHVPKSLLRLYRVIFFVRRPAVAKATCQGMDGASDDAWLFFSHGTRCTCSSVLHKLCPFLYVLQVSRTWFAFSIVFKGMLGCFTHICAVRVRDDCTRGNNCW